MGRIGDSAFPAEGCLLGRGKQARVGVSDQPYGSAGRRRSGGVQGAMADRVAVQGSEAEPARQDVRGDHGQRAQNADLDSTDCIAGGKVPAIAGQVPLESIEIDCAIETAAIRVSGSLALAGGAIRTADRTYRGRFATVAAVIGGRMTPPIQPGFAFRRQKGSFPFIFNGGLDQTRLSWTPVIPAQSFRSV